MVLGFFISKFELKTTVLICTVFTPKNAGTCELRKVVFFMKRMKMEITSIETIGEGYEEFKRYCEIRKYSKYTIMMLRQNRMGNNEYLGT